MVLIIEKIRDVDKNIEEGIQHKYLSYKLADELRQSSDDLTRMVRTYCVTGETLYKEYFQQILDIRNGVSARPEDYSGIFWDYVIPGNNKLEKVKTTSPIALRTLMVQAGYSETELSKLVEAEAKSNMLAELEIRAMAATEGRFLDEDGKLNRLGDPDRELAINLLHGQSYHRIKAEIMLPLDDFTQMVESRTHNELEVKYAQQSRLMTWAVVLMIGIIILISFSLFWFRKQFKLSALRSAVANNDMDRTMESGMIQRVESERETFQQKSKSKSVVPLLIAGGMVIGVLIGIFAFVSSRETKKIADLTGKMYRHPLAVSNAVLRANTAIIAMHRSMKDVALAENTQQLEFAITRVDGHEQEVYQEFNLIRERFLGKTAIVDKAYNAFVAWKVIRDEVISLQREGKQKDAAAITKGKGADHVRLLNQNIQELIDFARNKAAEFLTDSQDRYDKSHLYMLILIGLIGGAMSTVIIVIISRVRRIEQKNQSNEQRIRSIINTAADGIIVMNDQGIIQSFSPAAEKIFDFSESEVLGRNVKMLMPEPTRSEHDGYLKRYRNGAGGSFINRRAEAVGQRKNGQTFPIDINVSEFNLDGVRLFTGFIRDITEQKTAEQELRELSEAVKQSPASVVITNKEGLIEYVNPQFELISGYPAEEAIGQNPRILSAGKQPKEFYIDMWSAILEGNIWTGEFFNKRKNGEVFWENTSISPIKDAEGNIVKFIAVKEDITDRKKTETELRKLSKAITQSPVSVVITDIEGAIEYVNPRYCEVTGYTSDETIGQNPRILNAGIQPKEYFKNLWDTILSGDIWYGEFCNRKKNGEIYWESASISPLTDNNGKITHFVGIKEDITERRKMEVELKKAKQEAELLNKVTEIVSESETFDIALEKCLDSICGTTQWPIAHVYIPSLEGEEELTPTRIWHLGDEKVFSIFRNTTEKIRFKKGEGLPGRIWESKQPTWINNVQTDKSFFRKELAEVLGIKGAFGFPIMIKDELVAVCEFFTLTEMDLNEQWIKTMKSVSDQIGRVFWRKRNAEELKQAKQTAEAASIAKSQFLATVSHEIRTPMNAIIGLTNLALKTDLDTKQKGYLEKVDRSAFSLLGIINDILDFSKIEAGKLNIENIKFNLETVFETVNSLNSQKAQEKGLEFSFYISPDVPYSLVGDPLRIGQIITNYCSNAIKFTATGEIIIRIDVVEKISDKEIKLQFSVKDSGIGLTDEQKNRIFQEFSQADNTTTRKYGGTGLGLSISKKMVEMMGGETWLESEYGKGSTFYFNGVFGVQHWHHTVEYKSPAELADINVLVCDDNETALLICKESLDYFKFKVTTVSSGKEVITALHKSKYDLLIIDNAMPEMDGFETIQKIKNDKGYENLKIIMVSSSGQPELADRAMNIGVNGYLVKPYSYSSLFDLIMESFGNDLRTAKMRPQKGSKHQEALNQIIGSYILLIEDNEINQQVATELLEDAGFAVEIANNGQEAVDKVKTSGVPSKYSLVFMDLQMPIMDGYTATEEIRKLSQYKDLPIIAITADAMVGIKEKCIKKGMNDMIPKPIEMDEMFGAMVEWIKPDGKIKVAMPAGRQERDKGRESSSGKASADEVEIPDIPGLNIESALARMNNKKTLYLSVLEKFHSYNQNFIIEIKTTLNKDDYETAQRLIHTLKGLSGNIGAETLQEQSKLVEASIHEKDSVKIEERLNKLEIELKKLFGNISANIDFGVKKESQKLNVELIKEIIPKLIVLLENKSPKAKTLIKELEEAGLSGEEFDAMVNKINKYDFKNAIIILNKIEKH